MLYTEIHENPADESCQHPVDALKAVIINEHETIVCSACGEILDEIKYLDEPVKVYEIRENLPHLCAWCQSEYDDRGIKIRTLTPDEYAKTRNADSRISHGICAECEISAIRDGRII